MLILKANRTIPSWGSWWVESLVSHLYEWSLPFPLTFMQVRMIGRNSNAQQTLARFFSQGQLISNFLLTFILPSLSPSLLSLLPALSVILSLSHSHTHTHTHTHTHSLSLIPKHQASVLDIFPKFICITVPSTPNQEVYSGYSSQPINVARYSRIEHLIW